MPTYGKYAPQPERYGGANTRPLVQVLHEALNRARGTAYDTTENSDVSAENFAFARALWDVWETNRRLSYQNDPYRMSGACLARWERILSIPVDPEDTEIERRDRVRERFQRIGQVPKPQSIRDLLRQKLGAIFVDLHHISVTEAVIRWPGGTEDPNAPWYSTVAHIAVQLRKPANYGEQAFYAAAAKVFSILDPVLAARLTWDWYRNGDGHTGEWPTDPEAGFFLDDEHNLDNEIFDK